MTARKKSPRKSPTKRSRSCSTSGSKPQAVGFRYPSDPATAYARAVEAGTEIAGPLVRLACARHLRDLRDARDRGLVWKVSHVTDVIEFFEHVLKLPDVDDTAGEPVPFVLQPFQRFIVGSLFGWYRTSGERRFRVAYIEAGKGSGKTPLAAGIALYLLVVDGGKGSQIYAAAVTEDQAKLVFRDAEHMVDHSPELTELVEKTVNNLAIVDKGAFFRPVSAEKRGLDGKRVFGAVVDELHEHQTNLVVEKIRAGTKGRRNALVFEITNSGFDRTSVCWAHHENSRQILESTLTNDAWFAYICSFDEGDRWDEEGPHWLKANPCLPPTPETPQSGYSLTWDYLREQVTEALGMPSKEFLVRRLNFCEWTQSHTRHFDTNKWAACGVDAQGRRLIVPDEALDGVPCWGGLDLGQSDDLSAWALVWQLDDGVVARVRFWVPEASIELYPNRPYQEWTAAGVLETTEGDTTDYDVLQAAIAADCARWRPKSVAYDKRFADWLAIKLRGEGIDMIDTPQGFQLNEALKKLGELVSSGLFRHGGNPVLAWMAGNAMVKHGREGLIRLDKERSGEKIDGISAVVMAVARMIAIVVPKRSVYAKRGGYRVTAQGVETFGGAPAGDEAHSE